MVLLLSSFVIEMLKSVVVGCLVGASQCFNLEAA